MQKGSKHTKEALEKIKKARKERPIKFWVGKKFSEEHKKKLSDSHRGKTPWNKGKKFDGILHWNKGRKFTEEHREKLSECAQGRNAGEKCRFWKGGNYPERETLRKKYKNIKWRKLCLERDLHKCQRCGVKENLHVHHVKNWNEFPELRFEISNGITFCNSCHIKTHWDERRELKCQTATLLTNSV